MRHENCAAVWPGRIRRRDVIAMLGGAALARPRPASAETVARVPLVGVLSGGSASDSLNGRLLGAFREALAALGWVEGRNLRSAMRWSAGDPDEARAYATELAGLGPDVIFATTQSAVAAVVAATSTIPVVFTTVSDPVGSGLVASLARPGANVTGFMDFDPPMLGKWLQLLKESAPDLRRAALLFDPAGVARGAGLYRDPFRAAAAALSVEPVPAPIHDPAAIEPTLAKVAETPHSGVVVPQDIFSVLHREFVVASVARHRLPAVYSNPIFAPIGGLVCYGVDTADLFRRSAGYVDRILRGAHPADLPVQAPTKFDLVINLKTAKALGITMPQTLLVAADEVIE